MPNKHRYTFIRHIRVSMPNLSIRVKDQHPFFTCEHVYSGHMLIQVTIDKQFKYKKCLSTLHGVPNISVMLSFISIFFSMLDFHLCITDFKKGEKTANLPT